MTWQRAISRFALPLVRHLALRVEGKLIRPRTPAAYCEVFDLSNKLIRLQKKKDLIHMRRCIWSVW